MSAPPYMKLYVADYLADTMHLTRDEHGAYLLLLMAMWRAGGKLPGDDARLAKITMSTAKEWAELKPVILAFFTRRGAVITHKRLSREIAKYETVSEARKSAGKAGGRKTARKNNNKAEANAAILLEQKSSNCRHNQNQNQNQIEEDGGGERAGAVSDDWPEGNAANHAALIVAEVGSPWLDPHKSLALNTTTGRIAAWRRDGASWSQDVLPVIGALCAKQRGPVSSWKFFDSAIGRSIAENRAALEIPAATARATGPPSLTDRIAADHAEARRKAFALMDAQDGHSH
jgi:uncharacterized protein YdaU (DUF1376 family)